MRANRKKAQDNLWMNEWMNFPKASAHLQMRLFLSVRPLVGRFCPNRYFCMVLSFCGFFFRFYSLDKLICFYCLLPAFTSTQGRIVGLPPGFKTTRKSYFTFWIFVYFVAQEFKNSLKFCVHIFDITTLSLTARSPKFCLQWYQALADIAMDIKPGNNQ